MSARFRFSRRAPEPGYDVGDRYRNLRWLGTVEPVEVESHIRRGRVQASPWWQARCGEGHAVAVEQTARHGRRLAPVTMWERREDAATALLRHTEQAHP